ASSARPWTLRAEYTRVRNYVYSSSYGESFMLQGNSLAYPLGPDLARGTGQLAVDLDEDWRLRAGVDYLAKGEGHLGESVDNDNPDPKQTPPGTLEGVVEKTLTCGISARRFLRDDLRVEAELSPAWVWNAGHVEGTRAHRLGGFVSLDFRW